jgi:hypothetical protein
MTYYQFLLSPEGDVISFSRTKGVVGECKVHQAMDSFGKMSVGFFVDETSTMPSFLDELKKFIQQKCIK